MLLLIRKQSTLRQTSARQIFVLLAANSPLMLMCFAPPFLSQS
jgi:hypothetical protein